MRAPLVNRQVISKCAAATVFSSRNPHCLVCTGSTFTLVIQGIHWGMRSLSSHISKAFSTGMGTSCSALFSNHCAAVHLVPLLHAPLSFVPVHLCLILLPFLPAKKHQVIGCMRCPSKGQWSTNFVRLAEALTYGDTPGVHGIAYLADLNM